MRMDCGDCTPAAMAMRPNVQDTGRDVGQRRAGAQGGHKARGIGRGDGSNYKRHEREQFSSVTPPVH